MRIHRIALLIAVCVCVAGFAACNLNPQPLPPSDFGDNRADTPGGGGQTGFGTSDSGPADAGAAEPPTPQDASDAGTNTNGDGGDAGDDGGSDAGDAGDADAG